MYTDQVKQLFLLFFLPQDYPVAAGVGSLQQGPCSGRPGKPNKRQPLLKYLIKNLKQIYIINYCYVSG